METIVEKEKTMTDEIVMVEILDIDLDVIEWMIDEFNIETETWWTDNGVRMWFKKPILYKHKPEGICALGFKVKWKIVKNTENDMEENIEFINNKGILEELPEFLTNIVNAEDFFKVIINENEMLYEDEETIFLREQEKRKNMLFAHKFKINHLINYDKILKFINDNTPTPEWMTYVPSLKRKDLEIVIKGDKIKAEKENEYEVAKQLIAKLRIVKYQGCLYAYDQNQNHYRYGNYIKSIIFQELKGQKTQYVNEVIRQIEICSPSIKVPSEGWVIKFKNGCLYNGHWLDNDYTNFTPYYIDISYDSNVKPVLAVDEFLKTFTGDDKDYANFILETIAHCLITDLNVKRHIHFQRATFFHGDGGNGKGVLLNVIRALLGDQNVSSISLDRFSDERYLFTMRGKLANCSDDLKNKMIKEDTMKILKNLASNDVIELRKLYEQSVDEAISASLIFTTNHILKSLEKGEAWKRRVKWCPAFAKPKAIDPDLQKKLTSPEALEYWLNLVIGAYKRLYEIRKFTESKQVRDYTEQYHEENNTALAWVRSKGKEYFINKRSPQVYNDDKGDDYLTWHKENVGGIPLTNKQLKETILEVHGLVFKNTSVKGKSNWLFKEK